MPKYKYSREDIIRKKELDNILLNMSKSNYLGMPDNGWASLGAMFWLFGKRVSEIIRVKTDDIYIVEDMLCVRFTVLKKKAKSEPPVPITYTKRITMENPYSIYITKYWYKVRDTQQEYMYPNPRTKTGYVNRESVWKMLKSVSGNISPHLFRHSLATMMAEHSGTAYEIINWFDWDRTDTALEYIRRSGTMTQKQTNRKW